MKTPHTIRLFRQYEERRFNPITGEYEGGDSDTKEVPCLANYISQERVFRLYGDRVNRILIVRFNQEQEAFDKAEFDGKTFIPIELIDAPIKGAVRLKEVAHG